VQATGLGDRGRETWSLGMRRTGGSCALLVLGDVKCWGGNYKAQLGTGDTGNRFTPTSVSVGSGATQLKWSGRIF
jgi:hypothetical protein